jgi:hypothetical protein
MDPDEIDPATSYGPVGRNIPGAIDGRYPAATPGGYAPAPDAGDRGPTGTANSLPTIAAAIINSSMATHSAIVTVIVTLAMLTAVLAWSERVCRGDCP